MSPLTAPQQGNGTMSRDAFSIGAILRPVLLYALFSSLWILFSDKAVGMLFPDPAEMVVASTFKGWLFVGVTSALLYALLQQWRDRLLREHAEQRTVHPAPRTPRLSALLVALMLVVPLLGAAFVKIQVPQVEREAFSNLQAVSRLKAQQIESWLSERRGDAKMLAAHKAFGLQVQRLLQRKSDQVLADEISLHLQQLISNYAYDSALLVDDGGQLLLGRGKHLGMPGSELELVARAIANRQVQHGELFPIETGEIALDWVVPMTVSDAQGERAETAVVLRVVAGQFLFPLIQSWPTASASAETVLVRRQGETVEFLNELRHRKGVALTLEVPLDTPSLPAAVAIRSTEPGVVQGKDYRGVDVLTAYRSVAGTDWHILAKIDLDEVLAPMWHTLYWISLIAFAAIGSIMFVLMLLWRQQNHSSMLEMQAQKNKADQLVSALADNSSDAIFVKDLEGRYLLMNREVARVTGTASESALGKDDTAIFPPAQAAMLRENDARVIADNHIRTFEESITTEDGERTFLATKGPLRNSDGKVIGTFGISRDITDRKKTEAALQESEGRFRALADWTPEPFYLHRDGKIIYANPAAIRLLGAVSAKELIGRLYLDLVHPDFQQVVMDRVRNAIEHGVNAPPLEMTFVRLDGKPISVEAQATSIAYGGAPAVHVSVRDISERKQAEVIRLSLESQLRESQKMQAIGTLAGGIAHDFNNILATILGNVDLARADIKANAPALESLEEIRKAGVRARDLVQQILSFSRRQATDRKLIALTPVIEESVRLLRATMPSRLTLEVQCEAGLPMVVADATQIEQVVINLVTNAMQAMRSGRGHIGIRLDALRLDPAWFDAHPASDALRALHSLQRGRVIRLAVTDDGPGMDAATRARIFEPFFTTKPIDEGTGLGLSVVHGIVQAHEGAIIVQSQPGQGSTFTVFLPEADAAADVSAPVDSQAFVPAPLFPRGAKRARHILYLDDDEALVFLVRRQLEMRSHRVSTFTDQHEALEALRAAPDTFDLVVSDYNMPGMSGLDIARAVRAIRADLPVAVASGFIDESLRAQAEGAGVCELIFKASAVEDLCQAFERLARAVDEKAV